jgi:2-hydroxychromene-2-carboxylate isomerase
MPGVTAESLDREVEDILAPLRAKLRQIDGELEQLDLQRAELKAIRTKVARIVGANQTYAKPGPKVSTHGGKGVSEKNVETVAAFLRDNFNGSQFHAPEIRDRVAQQLGLTDNVLNQALKTLHARGALRLVRTGVPGVGTRTKVWEVTKRGEA